MVLTFPYSIVSMKIKMNRIKKKMCVYFPQFGGEWNAMDGQKLQQAKTLGYRLENSHPQI